MIRLPADLRVNFLLLKEAALKAYANQQEEIKRQEAVIDKLKSFNREKSVRRAESRQKMLDKIDKLKIGRAHV